MRKAAPLACALLFFLAVVASADDWRKGLPPKDKVAEHLQEISVTIKAGGSEGSGVIVTRLVKRDGKDVKVNFVVTAAHVVDGLRKVTERIDPKTGTKRQVVTFADCHIVRELNEAGRAVGELKMSAEVIRYSESEDIAILRVRKTDFVSASTTFYLDEKIPPIGTELYHVGSLLGQLGSNSMTTGIVSQIGRVLDDKKEYDQTTATAFPGSSGGGVYEQSGAYVGMITRGAGEGFNLMVPIRRLREWAGDAGVGWIFDASLPVPTEKELEKMPIEDLGVEFDPEVKKAVNKNFPTLIRRDADVLLDALLDGPI